jgi:uncharacterized protein YceK
MELQNTQLHIRKNGTLEQGWPLQQLQGVDLTSMLTLTLILVWDIMEAAPVSHIPLGLR